MGWYTLWLLESSADNARNMVISPYNAKLQDPRISHKDQFIETVEQRRKDDEIPLMVSLGKVK